MTDAAEASIAAVHYHFGSKGGLLRAVVERAMASVNEERRQLLEELRASDTKPSVEDLVRAFVITGASLVDRHGPRGTRVARLLGRVMCEPDPAIRRIFAMEVSPVEGRYLEALVAALPRLPSEEAAFRYRAMVGLLALHQAGTLADLHPGEVDTTSGGDCDPVEQLVIMLSAMLQAPPARPSSP